MLEIGEGEEREERGGGYFHAKKQLWPDIRICIFVFI
jgi:hypothetical protein